MNQLVIVFILALALCLNLGSSITLRPSLENHTSDCNAERDAFRDARNAYRNGVRERARMTMIDDDAVNDKYKAAMRRNDKDAMAANEDAKKSDRCQNRLRQMSSK